MPANETTTTLTLFRMRRWEQFYAFRQIVMSVRAFEGVHGARFLRFMGTGHGRGFSAWPDFSQYLLLGVFEDAQCARRFHERSPWIRTCTARALERYELTLEPVSSSGRWDDETPFGDVPARSPGVDGPIIVITRARIRLPAIPSFLRSVPAVSAALDDAATVASVGFGEFPWVRQATFSVWESESALERFAYQDGPHKVAMDRARRERWFAEDLFARFRPVRSEGTWHGRDPLREVSS